MTFGCFPVLETFSLYSCYCWIKLSYTFLIFLNFKIHNKPHLFGHNKYLVSFFPPQIFSISSNSSDLFFLSGCSGQPEGDVEISIPLKGRAQSGGSVEPQTSLPVSEPGPAQLPCDILPGRANGGYSSRRAPRATETKGRKPHG